MADRNDSGHEFTTMSLATSAESFHSCMPAVAPLSPALRISPSGKVYLPRFLSTAAPSNSNESLRRAPNFRAKLFRKRQDSESPIHFQSGLFKLHRRVTFTPPITSHWRV
ncbi:hypothetical protein TNCV_3288831 [Trichonephila clavipes]|nr:hypothetical protein TNCV_3288831 [Trichonephila clavipes]